MFFKRFIFLRDIFEQSNFSFSALKEEEKDVIRQRLLANFNEPSHQICTQMSVLVAKIARVDCPRNWPNLLPTLLQSVRCDNTLLQGRALMVLHHVLKTLASKRLAADRKLFEDVRCYLQNTTQT